MKMIRFVIVGLSSLCVLRAADFPLSKFPNERIGLPPLSLSESIAKGVATPKPLQFGTGFPSYSALADPPNVAPGFLPSAVGMVAMRESTRNRKAPRVSRAWGMPIIEPNNTVDYALIIVPPDPSIDFKMVLKEPTPPWPVREGSK
jgi:hypothetical protein